MDSQLAGTFIGACSALLGVAITQWYTDKRQRKAEDKNLHYLAIRLVYLFRAYSDICASALMDHGNAVSSEGNMGQYLTGVPEFSSLSNTDDYRLLEHKLLVKVLGFPDLITQAHDYIDYSYGWGDDDDIEGEKVKYVRVLGRHARSIAEDIERQYKLPKQESLSELEKKIQPIT